MASKSTKKKSEPAGLDVLDSESLVNTIRDTMEANDLTRSQKRIMQRMLDAALELHELVETTT